ncbi:MAG: hypothetical protein K0R27_1444, partial [Xanthobacteraceae bacterium]|nr:hypothetical protein [Xanthobacteraceae bacterium]
AVYVVPAAAAAGTTGRRTLQVDGDVFMGDKVQTGPGGEAQIQFKDATKLVVGPNSSMTIDAFVFDERNTARKITMNAAKGAFRFITGNSEKQAYTINTPTATIGIRGTRFDFSVAGNGEMTFALFDGQARVCDRAGNCRDVRGNCEVVVTPPGGGVDPAAWSPSVAGRFPYVQSQDSLHASRAFRQQFGSGPGRAARALFRCAGSRTALWRRLWRGQRPNRTRQWLLESLAEQRRPELRRPKWRQPEVVESRGPQRPELEFQPRQPRRRRLEPFPFGWKHPNDNKVL